jgi:hypothetical protein
VSVITVPLVAVFNFEDTMNSNRSFLFRGQDGVYIAYPLTEGDQTGFKWKHRVEFLFSQVFGTASVLATTAAVYYLLVGNGPYCVAGAVLSSICTSLFIRRIAH